MAGYLAIRSVKQKGVERVSPETPTLNPWSILPQEDPYVLACDRPFIDAFNEHADESTRIHCELLPEPFLGPADAPVVLLLLNPGYHPDDVAIHSSSAFSSHLRAALTSGTAEHIHITADPVGPAQKWWNQAIASLAARASLKAVARGLLVVQYFPYHSETFRHAHIRLPSQSFTFGLVERAITRGAEIVVGRGYEIWLGAIPMLGTYPRQTQVKNVRRVSLSPGNLRDSKAFERIVQAVMTMEL